MTQLALPWVGGPPRGGRVLETPAGLVDLPTGLPARLTCDAVRPDDVTRLLVAGWRTEDHDGDGAAGETCVDAWLTQDWLGRWQQRRVMVRPPSRTGLCVDRSLPAAALASEGAIGVTGVVAIGAWLAIAAQVRGHGLVPVHVSLLAYLIGDAAAGWPPLVVGVPRGEDVAAVGVALGVSLRRGARIAMLVGLAARASDPPMTPAFGGRPAVPLQGRMR